MTTLTRSLDAVRPRKRRGANRLRAGRRLFIPSDLGRLEERLVLSVTGTFELDANTTTGVLGPGAPASTTTSHDWDQVYADFVNQTKTSGALATAFVSDKFNSTTDDIFLGG